MHLSQLRFPRQSSKWTLWCFIYEAATKSDILTQYKNMGQINNSKNAAVGPLAGRQMCPLPRWQNALRGLLWGDTCIFGSFYHFQSLWDAGEGKKDR